VTPRRPTIEIDRERCMGSGTCMFHAPNTFDMDDESRAVLLPDPVGDPDDVDDPHDIAAAIDGCPTAALRIVDGPVDGGPTAR
jgi:ferredoxin